MTKLFLSAILFDVGNTLLHASKLMETALKETSEFLEVKGAIPNRDEFVHMYRDVDRKTQGPKINHLYSDIDIIRPTLHALNIEYSISLVEMFITHYRQVVKNNLKRNRKLVDLFAHLKHNRFKIGIITDGTTIEQIEQLRKLGILKYLDSLITSEDIGVEKPSNKIFAKGLSSLAIRQPEDAAMVGDDIIRDIGGAQSMGMRTVLIMKYSVNVEHSTIKPDLSLTEIYSLPKHIEWKNDG